MNGTGPRWPDLDDVADARVGATYARPDGFAQATEAAAQTEAAYIRGVGHQIEQQEPEAGG